MALDTLDKLVSQIDASIFIVTASDSVERGGCVVSFLTQASLDPVRFIVCINHASHTYGLIEDSRACCVHWVDRGQAELVRHFAQKTGFEEDKLGGLEWAEGQTGSPVLAACPGYAELELRRELVCGDHTAYLGDPIEAGYLRPFQPFRLQDAHSEGIT